MGEMNPPSPGSLFRVSEVWQKTSHCSLIASTGTRTGWSSRRKGRVMKKGMPQARPKEQG